jgi:hypothetical protein
MRAWERVTYQERCGHCGALLKAGDAMQTVSRHGLNRKLIRCGVCADGDVPPDLPESPVHVSVQEQIGRMQSLQSVMPTRTRGSLKEMAREWMPYKETREPGEDG